MKKDTDDNKNKMILALERSLGIVTPACKEVGISRETFYRWLKEDPDFKNRVKDIDEYTLDFVENQLLKKIKDGNDKAIMFYMRYKARKRGYTDSLDITTDGEKINEIKLIRINKKDENEQP